MDGIPEKKSAGPRPRMPGGKAGRTADQAAGIAAMVWATAAVSFLP